MRHRLPTALACLLGCASAAAALPPDLDLVEFATGLSAPLAVRAAPDGSGRLYVVERGGRIVAVDAAGAILGEVLDFADDPPPFGFTAVSGGDERGLLGLAFHPQFPTDPRMFVYYTDGNPGGVNGLSDTVVASYAVSTAGAVPAADAGSATVVLRVDQDFNNHNGGDIHFGADGYLYIALGDGGGGGDPCGRAQTLDPASLSGAAAGGSGGDCAADQDFLDSGGNADSRALLGKLLRIDVDQATAAGANGLCAAAADGSAAYAIPGDGLNPFAGGGTADGCDEVWHYGLRNPYRFSFDRATADLFIGDVGQDQYEEVDFASGSAAGLNFGWNLCEGTHAYPGGGACTAAGTVAPILEYAHAVAGEDNCSVTGGYRYRGAIGGLHGRYVFADYCSGRIFTAVEDAGSWSASEWRNLGHLVSSFGEDGAGELYATDFFGGRVLKFTAPLTVFSDGFESP